MHTPPTSTYHSPPPTTQYIHSTSACPEWESEREAESSQGWVQGTARSQPNTRTSLSHSVPSVSRLGYTTRRLLLASWSFFPLPLRHSLPHSVPRLAHDDFVLLLLISTTTTHLSRKHHTAALAVAIARLLPQYRVHPGRRLCPRSQTPAVTSASHARCSSPPLAAPPHLTSHHPHRSTTGGNSRRTNKKKGRLACRNSPPCLWLFGSTAPPPSVLK